MDAANIPKFDMQKIKHMILTLCTFGVHSSTGVCLTAFSNEWVAAQKCVAEWSRDAGLNIRFDTAGNLWTRIDGTEGGKAIVSGSHIDSRCPGGRYDGALGVLSARAAGIRTMQTNSGAGHDAQQMAEICLIAMIFVRSQGGHSHTPEEFSTIDYIVAGITVSAGTLYNLAYKI